MKISYSPKYCLSNEQALELAAQKLPLQFKGKSAINLQIVNGYRRFIRQNPKIAKLVQVEHIADIAPVAADLKKYILANPASPEITSMFLQEITEREVNKKINPVWLIFVHLRYAAAISELSKDERNLFKHVVNPQILTGLFENKSWSEHYATLTSIGLADDQNNSITAHFIYENVHYDMSGLIDDQLLKYFPAPVFYPFPGIGKFGICFLVQSYLNQIYPMGLPASNSNDNRLQAHGVRLSRASFLIHDLLHADVDPRQDSIKRFIIRKAEEYYLRGGDVKPFIQAYTPLAVMFYIFTMQGLMQIYNAFIKYLLPHYGKAEFQRAIAGFFLLVHELPAYPDNIYCCNDLEDIVHSLVSRSKYAQKSKYSWESTFDPLHTSPFDGKPKYTKDQIYQFIANKFADDGRISLPDYYNINPAPDRGEYIKQQVAGYKVTNSDRFVDVEVRFRTGQTLKYSMATLYHKWTNLDDSIGLLKLAGITTTKPDITGLELEPARKVVLQTIKQVRSELIRLMDDFEIKAKFFTNTPLESETSMSQKYFTWHFNKTGQINSALDKSIELIKQRKEATKIKPS